MEQSTLKTYTKVSEADEAISFRISKMEETFVQRNGQVDAPHRHDFYTVLFIKAGKGKHFVDFEAYELGDYQAFFIGPGQVHQLVEESPTEGFSILFSQEFLAKNHVAPQFIEDISLFHDFNSNPPLQLTSKQFESIQVYANEMLDWYDKSVKHQNDALGALLKLSLIVCNNACDANPIDAHQDSGSTLLRSFKNLVNKNYHHWHASKDYASELNISADHLNRTVKALTGKTSKEHIQSRITLAAKRLLYFSDLSNKEIGFELGFGEPANFSAFFKKCTGQSPNAYRKT